MQTSNKKCEKFLNIMRQDTNCYCGEVKLPCSDDTQIIIIDEF